MTEIPPPPPPPPPVPGNAAASSEAQVDRSNWWRFRQVIAGAALVYLVPPVAIWWTRRRSQWTFRTRKRVTVVAAVWLPLWLLALWLGATTSPNSTRSESREHGPTTTLETSAEREKATTTTALRADPSEQLGAFNACKKAVTDQLKAPLTAEFRTFHLHEPNTEVTVTGPENGLATPQEGEGDDPLIRGRFYTVISTVDSENGYGALIRSRFVCRVRQGAEYWYLDDLQLSP